MGTRLSEPQPLLDLLKAHDGLIVLGDPGAGKTTFLKYLALRLALGEGETLGVGARLPVLVPLSAYANALEDRDVPLVRFIAAYYRDRGIDLPLGPLLEALSARGGVLFLLDGLDEVRDLSQRSLVVERVLDCFAFERDRGNKAILTSRIVGYREVRAVVGGLQECTLVDFEKAEITDFVEKWTSALERAARGDTALAVQEAASERAELLEAIDRNPGVRQLAANPLLLTILALMKRQGVLLPERRVELYQKYVETLLKHWNLARGLDRPLRRDLDVVETMRVLAPLALWMHETSPGVGLVKHQALRRKLAAIYRDREIPDPERAARHFLDDVHDYAGLLVERGAGAYGFVHLTFQEYLAGVAIAQQGQRALAPVVAALAAHLGDANWREVSLLTIGYLGIVQQRDEAAGEVLWTLIQEDPGEPGTASVFAGEAVADAWPGGVTLGCKEKVAKVLLETLRADARVQPRLRAAAGKALARLGDPRPEVLTLDGMQFCCVPPGFFWMGGKVYDNEKPQHLNKSLDVPYWIGRYPVTVAQFRAFVEASGIRPGDNDRLRGRDNEPAVWVSWHEALAFCDWLTRTWRERGWLPDSCCVCLPSEAEWEKASRGGVDIPLAPICRTAARLFAEEVPDALSRNPLSKRRYPWGEGADANRVNYGETGIHTTSAVGCFPGGCSPYGVEELSGNVYEWTRSLYKGYPCLSGDGREDLTAGNDVARVLRGGAFFNYGRLVRCAYRDSDDPNRRDHDLGFRVVVSPIPSDLCPSGL